MNAGEKASVTEGVTHFLLYRRVFFAAVPYYLQAGRWINVFFVAEMFFSLCKFLTVQKSGRVSAMVFHPIFCLSLLEPL